MLLTHQWSFQTLASPEYWRSSLQKDLSKPANTRMLLFAGLTLFQNSHCQDLNLLTHSVRNQAGHLTKTAPVLTWVKQPRVYISAPRLFPTLSSRREPAPTTPIISLVLHEQATGY